MNAAQKKVSEMLDFVDNVIGSALTQYMRGTSRQSVPLALPTLLPAVPDVDAPLIHARPTFQNEALPLTLYCDKSGIHNTECPICLEILRENETRVRNWPCGHVVCEMCADSYIKLTLPDSKCVVCRRGLRPPYPPPDVFIGVNSCSTTEQI